MAKKTAVKKKSGTAKSTRASGSSAFAKTWKKGREAFDEGAGAGREELDDGVYKAQLHSMERGTSQNGRDQIAECWVIKAGENKGKKAYEYNGIESEERIPFFYSRMGRLGYEPDISSEEDLEAFLKEVTKDKPLAKIRLRTKGDFQNLYIQKLIDADDVDDEEGEEEAEEEAGEEEEESEEESEEEVEEEEEPEEQEVDITVGTKVSFEMKGEEMSGSVVEVDEEKEQVVVKVGTKKYRLKFDRLFIPGDDETVEEEEIPDEPDLEGEEEEEPSKKSKAKQMKPKTRSGK